MKLMANQGLCAQMSEKSLQIAPPHDLKHAADIFESIYEQECANWKLVQPAH
jgi:hypothetical protein